MVPAMAVPKDEPRFEMLRDRPEISPWRASAKLDCTTFTDGVSITPSPRPIRSRPGTKAMIRSVETTRAISRPTPHDRHDEAGQDQRPLRAALREPLRARGTRPGCPTVAAVKITPVSMAL